MPDAVVVADRDVAAGEHEAGSSLDPLRNDDAPTLTTKSSWKMTRPATAPMPSAPFRSSSPMQITVMMPRRVTVLVPDGAPQHLVVGLAGRVELGHSGIEEAEVEHGDGEADGEAERGPRAARAAGRSRSAAAPTMSGGDDGAAQDLGQRVAARGPRARRACSWPGPYRYVRICLMTLIAADGQAERQADQQEGRRRVQRARPPRSRARARCPRRRRPPAPCSGRPWRPGAAWAPRAGGIRPVRSPERARTSTLT